MDRLLDESLSVSLEENVFCFFFFKKRKCFQMRMSILISLIFAIKSYIPEVLSVFCPGRWRIGI